MATTTPAAVTTATVRFRKVLAGMRSTKRKYKAAGYLREYVARFSNADPDSIAIDPKLNEYIMKEIINTGGSLRVEISRNAGKVSVKQVGASAPQANAAAPKEAVKEGFPQEAAKKPAQQKAQAKAAEKAPAAQPAQVEQPAKAAAGAPAEKPKAARKAQKGDAQPKAEGQVQPAAGK